MHRPARLRHSVHAAILTTLGGMDSSDLTKEQCEQIYGRLGPIQLYLHALHERVRQNAFPQDDALRQLVEQADKAVHSLRVELHSLGIERMREKQK